MDIKKLLKDCGCRNIEELWSYIVYLKGVKEDYEFLKNKIRDLKWLLDELY
jgi:hypothetical protein